METSSPAGSGGSSHGGSSHGGTPRRPGVPRRQFLAGAGLAGAGAFAASAVGLGTPNALAAARAGASRQARLATGGPATGPARPERSVAVGTAARPVRNPLHGQPGTRRLRGLARRPALRGTRLQRADRPAHLQPLAGPRLRAAGERPRDHRPVGSDPADLLLPLLRPDAARRSDRQTGGSRPLPAPRRLHPGILGSGPGRDRAGRTAPSVFNLDLGQTATGGYEPGKTSLQAAADYTAYAVALTHPPGRAYSSRLRCWTPGTPGCSAWSVPGPGCPTMRSSTSTTRLPRRIRRPPASRPLPIPAAPRYGWATRPAPGCPGWPPAAWPARRWCSPRTSPWAPRPRRCGAR